MIRKKMKELFFSQKNNKAQSSERKAFDKTSRSGTKIAVMDVARGTLFRVAKDLKKYNVQPVLWIGYPKYNNQAKEVYPDCEFYDYWRFNGGSSLLLKGQGSAPNDNIIKSFKFLELKDKVLKMMDRQDSHGTYRLLEREAMFYSLFFFFYGKVIEKKVDLLLSAHSPHLPANMVLFGVCEILNVKTVHVREMSIAPLTYLATSFENDFLVTAAKGKGMEGQLNEIVKYINSFSRYESEDLEPLYMKQQKADSRNTREISVKSSDYAEHLLESYSGENPPQKDVSYRMPSINFLEKNKDLSISGFSSQKAFREAVAGYIRSQYSEEKVEAGFEENYVYFPLHYEPEKTSNPDGGSYYNTYNAIAALRAFVPESIAIYVKEHYTQLAVSHNGYLGKSPYFYKSVGMLKNVHFVNEDVATTTLIEKALFTVSQTGSACFEAACMEKKALLMGSVWFSGCPNIFSFDDVSDINEILEAPIKSRADIVNYMNEWVGKHAIYGCVTGSFIRYNQGKFGEDAMLDSKRTRKEIVNTLRYNKIV